jgi:hypothetical protein
MVREGLLSGGLRYVLMSFVRSGGQDSVPGTIMHPSRPASGIQC